MRPIAAVERHLFRGITGLLRRGLLAGAMCAASAIAWAGPSVSYTAIDEADGATGDLWRYDYTVKGPLDSFGGVVLEYAPTLYADLLFASSDNDNSLTADQPNPGLGTTGLITLQRISEMQATDTTTFSVEFIWLGTGAPGSQVFQVFNGNFEFSENMRTVAAAASGVIPEPTGLVLAALLALAVTTRRQRRGV